MKYMKPHFTVSNRKKKSLVVEVKCHNVAPVQVPLNYFNKFFMYVADAILSKKKVKM